MNIVAKLSGDVEMCIQHLLVRHANLDAAASRRDVECTSSHLSSLLLEYFFAINGPRCEMYSRDVST